MSTETRMRKLAAALGILALGALATPTFAAEGQMPAKDISFSFEGPFGTFDRAQLQRGFQVYKEVCSACHSMELLSFRNLGDPGGPEFPEEQVKAIAAEYQVQAGPNDEGEMFERPGLPSDRFPHPFPNTNAARAANGGALPPDLSLLTKSRPGWYGTFNQLINGIGGPQYVYSILTGYQEPPEDLAASAPPGKMYNPYFSAGHWIGMPPPLADDQISYSDGTPATVDQMARDVSAFMTWAAEPKLEQRKELGFQVLIYVAILTVLLYLTKQKIWSRIKH
ncbi:cytochrome c1 [Rhodoligotrophos appendicifer]|uniref:cytochrome c1 n=1 Tax=Rhodoligotrophos appendicifer TaxID=987056 RepID=UPI0011846C19|nr:cytochrome c1 [Rhodoligotrophos appendicifer]